jgi:hypothetical protein
MACRLGDSYEARKYFAKLTVNDKGSWSQDEWDKCRYLVRPEPPHPALQGAATGG